MTDTDTPLSGSPRQVAWAERIRAAAVDALADPPAELTTTEEQRTATLALLASVTHAHWWIETRYVDGWRWPALLGESLPAVPKAVGDLGRSSLRDPMALASGVRQALDAADISRVAYGLWVEEHTLYIQLLGATRGGPDREGRRDLAAHVWQALVVSGRWTLIEAGRELSEWLAGSTLMGGDLVQLNPATDE